MASPRSALFLRADVARLACPAGWRGRTVATGNIKVRLRGCSLQEPIGNSQPACSESLVAAVREFPAVIPCCYKRFVRMRHASHD